MRDTKSRSFFSRYKTVILVSSVVLLLLFLIAGTVAYQKREGLLKAAVAKAITKAKTKYNLDVKIQDFGFDGLSAVYFRGISVVPEHKDSLAKVAQLKVGIKIFPLLFGHIKISQLNINDAVVSLVKKDTLSNYDFLFRKDNSDTLKVKTKVDLAELADKLLNKALDKIPDDMNVRNFLIKFDQDTTHFTLLTETATIIDGEVQSVIKLNTNQAVWHVTGTAKPGKKQLDLKLFADNKRVEFPYLDKKYGLKISFDTIRSVMRNARKIGKEFEIDGSWSVRNLIINQPRIASSDVIVKSGSIDARILIGRNYLELDSSSVISLGKAEISPFIKFTLGDKKIYELKVNAYDQVAQDVFDAFPIGLFESLEGIKVKGKLNYALNFYLDAARPDDVIFSSTLNGSEDFKILQFGATDFRKINSPFVYTPYEKGKPVRDIVVGPSNSNYTPIELISPNLKNALLTAEDPSFYSHKGFVEESIRQSIATNFKAKSFKRGGSTISMQLVKNVFLSRQKNLARKFEEILIVWLIENQRLSSKSRMFEVYLNIIEWGRNVYGIGEAAHYYFGKSPSALSVGESIYLASIVPKPKSSLYKWEYDGSLKSYLTGYFKLIGRLMAKRGYIEADSSAYGFYGVRLKESLRRQIAPDDFVPDSLAEEDDGGLFNLNIFNKKPTKDSIEKKESFLKRVFDSSPKKDTIEKSPRDLRKERREKRKKQ